MVCLVTLKTERETHLEWIRADGLGVLNDELGDLRLASGGNTAEHKDEKEKE